jgi:hypothetical protein
MSKEGGVMGECWRGRKEESEGEQANCLKGDVGEWSVGQE